MNFASKRNHKLFGVKEYHATFSEQNLEHVTAGVFKARTTAFLLGTLFIAVLLEFKLFFDTCMAGTNTETMGTALAACRISRACQ